MATLGLSALPPSGISCGVAATRRWWTRCWMSPSVGCWSATSMAAYHHYPGLKQRCWVHLLRDIHDLKILYPKDRQLARWAAAVHHIYSAAKSFAHPQARQRQRVQQQLERKLLAQCRPYAQDPAAAQGNLCRRIERHIKELFVFVAAPGVPSDNNAAERSLRPLVVSRKISGGTRSGRAPTPR